MYWANEIFTAFWTFACQAPVMQHNGTSTMICSVCWTCGSATVCHTSESQTSRTAPAVSQRSSEAAEWSAPVSVSRLHVHGLIEELHLEHLDSLLDYLDPLDNQHLSLRNKRNVDSSVNELCCGIAAVSRAACACELAARSSTFLPEYCICRISESVWIIGVCLCIECEKWDLC